MNRDKQIEEMTAIIADCGICIYHGDVCTREEEVSDQLALCIAKVLSVKGYRKASEVIRDIFNDLNEMWYKGRGFINYSDLVRLERLHEQKYTEGE